MPKKTSPRKPAPVADEGILTPEEFAARPATAAPLDTRRNHALHRGGSVDIHTNAEEAVAVVRYVEITDQIRKEIAPLLSDAREKIAAAAQSPLPAE